MNFNRQGKALGAQGLQVFCQNNKQFGMPVTTEVLEYTEKSGRDSHQAASSGWGLEKWSKVLKRKLCAISRAFHLGKKCYTAGK